MTDIGIPPIVIEQSGAGIAPAGVSSGGLYSPASVAAVSRVLAGSRYIDPSTKDYAIDDNLNFRQMPKNRQRVLLALTTTKGSSAAMPSLGIQRPGKITSRFKAELEVFVRTSLIHLTDARRPAIAIDGIMADVVSTGRVLITVSYTDNETGERDAASVYAS